MRVAVQSNSANLSRNSANLSRNLKVGHARSATSLRKARTVAFKYKISLLTVTVVKYLKATLLRDRDAWHVFIGESFKIFWLNYKLGFCAKLSRVTKTGASISCPVFKYKYNSRVTQEGTLACR